MKRAERICKILLGATALAAVVYGAVGTVQILNAPFTSFPWWAAWGYAALWFALPLCAEAAVCLWLHRKNRDGAS